MADKQAKLAAALKKRADTDDLPRPEQPAPSAPADRETLKLRKGSLLNVATWEGLADKLEVNGKHDAANLHETVGKLFGNVLANPTEPKYRKIRSSNPNFAAKVWSCKGAPELFELAGWKDTVEEGFLVLPETGDVSLLQKALDALAAHAAARADGEEKKRKLDQEKAAKAREERAQKARDEAYFDAAAASSSSKDAQMVDEDEAMVAAIEDFVEQHPEAVGGRALDSFDIERQVAGPGGSVVASVAASAGTQYFDYVAHMRRSDSGAWSVQKLEASS